MGFARRMTNSPTEAQRSAEAYKEAICGLLDVLRVVMSTRRRTERRDIAKNAIMERAATEVSEEVMVFAKGLVFAKGSCDEYPIVGSLRLVDRILRCSMFGVRGCDRRSAPPDGSPPGRWPIEEEYDNDRAVESSDLVLAFDAVRKPGSPAPRVASASFRPNVMGLNYMLAMAAKDGNLSEPWRLLEENFDRVRRALKRFDAVNVSEPRRSFRGALLSKAKEKGLPRLSTGELVALLKWNGADFLTHEEAEWIAKNASAPARQALSWSSGLPASALSVLARDGSPRVRRAVADRSDLPEELALNMVLAETDAGVLRSLVWRDYGEDCGKYSERVVDVILRVAVDFRGMEWEFVSADVLSHFPKRVSPEQFAKLAEAHGDILTGNGGYRRVNAVDAVKSALAGLDEEQGKARMESLLDAVLERVAMDVASDFGDGNLAWLVNCLRDEPTDDDALLFARLLLEVGLTPLVSSLRRFRERHFGGDGVPTFHERMEAASAMRPMLSAIERLAGDLAASDRWERESPEIGLRKRNFAFPPEEDLRKLIDEELARLRESSGLIGAARVRRLLVEACAGRMS